MSRILSPLRLTTIAAFCVCLGMASSSDLTNTGALQEIGLCDGLVASITGSSGDDTLIGTDGPDIIAGLQGDDIILGLAGNDRICGGSGSDVIIGGLGFDVMYGGRGNDAIYFSDGQLESQRIDIAGGRAFGGAGNDDIYGSTRWDRMRGGPGNDRLFGFEGRDWLRGGVGIDTLNGGPNVDDVAGGRSSRPSPEFVTASDLFRTCGNLHFDGPVDEDLRLVPIPNDVKQILDAEIERIGADAVGTDVVQWFLVSRADGRISIAHKRPNGDADSYTEGHLRLTDEGWRGGGWGPCEVRFSAENRQSLRWTLDAPLDTNDSVISVLAQQNWCGSEPPLEISSIKPVIVSTPERITVLLVAPVPPPSESDHLTCRLPESHVIDVDLTEPLGDRKLHDGGTPAIGSQRYPNSDE